MHPIPVLQERLEFVGVPQEYGKKYGGVVWGSVLFNGVWLPAALGSLPDACFDVDCLEVPVRIPVHAQGHILIEPPPPLLLLRFMLDTEASYLVERLDEVPGALALALKKLEAAVPNKSYYIGPLRGTPVPVDTSHIPELCFPFIANTAQVARLYHSFNPELTYTVTVLQEEPEFLDPMQLIWYADEQAGIGAEPFYLRPFEPPIATLSR